jgi:hypothetical protein
MNMKKYLSIFLSISIIAVFTLTGYTSISAAQGEGKAKSPFLTIIEQTPTPTQTVAPTDTSTPTPTQTVAPTDTSTLTPTPSTNPDPTPSYVPTEGPTPIPTIGAITVSNNAQLTAALSNPAVTFITFTAGTYSGFTINKPVVIDGHWADISSGIIINSSNVEINNLDVTASTSLVSNPEGEAGYMHGYSIAPNLTEIMIYQGSITGASNSNTKGIYFQIAGTINGDFTDANSNNGSASIADVKFANLSNGIVCNGADSLYVIGCTFSGNRIGIGNTEYTTFTDVL